MHSHEITGIASLNLVFVCLLIFVLTYTSYDFVSFGQNISKDSFKDYQKQTNSSFAKFLPLTSDKDEKYTPSADLLIEKQIPMTANKDDNGPLTFSKTNNSDENNKIIPLNFSELNMGEEKAENSNNRSFASTHEINRPELKINVRVIDEFIGLHDLRDESINPSILLSSTGGADFFDITNSSSPLNYVNEILFTNKDYPRDLSTHFHVRPGGYSVSVPDPYPGYSIHYSGECSGTVSLTLPHTKICNVLLLDSQHHFWGPEVTGTHNPFLRISLYVYDPFSFQPYYYYPSTWSLVTAIFQVEENSITRPNILLTNNYPYNNRYDVRMPPGNYNVEMISVNGLNPDENSFYDIYDNGDCTGNLRINEVASCTHVVINKIPLRSNEYSLDPSTNPSIIRNPDDEQYRIDPSIITGSR